LSKHLKLNIKNVQLAKALKPTKPEAAAVKPGEEEPKKRLTRLRDDTPKEAVPAVPPKRKARIMQSPSDVKPVETPKEEVVEEVAPPAPVPVVEEVTPPAPVAAAQAPSAPAPVVEKPKPAAPVQQAAPSAPAASHAPSGPAAPRREPPKDLRAGKKKEEVRFDGRDRQGLRDVDNAAWRKRRIHKAFKPRQEEAVIRPKELKVRLPITIKDLAQEMKLKASQLIAKLFMKGVALTLNDYLEDETTVQLLGHDFDCEITIDTSDEQRMRITDQTIRQEVEATPPSQLVLRPPVVTFMGHVDHGKTSLIDSIRKSNRAAGEAGAITQHIGAFKVSTSAGNVTILDTPGHEAFSEMRSRGANVTDIVILVVAGDEGIRAQTEEAMRQAREANVPILVAINKADKPNFDVQKVYRDLADRELLPEAWGGTTITVNCSAVTGQGINELLEMIALQAEVLELRANPNSRGRGSVLESEMHKGLVFGHFSGRIKTMQDEWGKHIEEAGPSTPIKITGLSELPLAGNEFIVVKNEKEARELAEARAEAHKHTLIKPKMGSMEKMMAKKESSEMKILPVILRADVQGSLEALKNSLMKIKSTKVRLEIVNAGVGEISESDIELAAASKATIVGFHTSIESRADDLIKQKGVAVYTQDVIYHLIDEVKLRMKSLLDKIEQENNTGAAQVKAVFKSSQLGLIAGCQVIEGLIKRQHLVRQIRGKEVIWKGKMASLKRMKEDVKEVKEGFECGILLEGQTDIKEGDIIQAYELTYLEQDL
jgi:translation initiation factor IF-2